MQSPIRRLLLLAALLGFSLSLFARDYPVELTVALDGSGDFSSIQAAIDATKSFPGERITIRIKNGTYREKVEVFAWNSRVSLVGESRDGTVIIYDDSFSTINRGRNSTFHTYTLKVSGNDFHAENLSIVNSAGPVGQAVALHLEADRAAFINVSIKGHQDTLYVAGEGSRSYFRHCYIEGTTDFIFGAGTALFENCEVRSLGNSYITAASTPKNQAYGLVFQRCRLTADPGVNAVYLGRPWREYARTVFLNSEFGDHIVAAGWHNWDRESNEKTAFFAEFGNGGPGADTSQRVPWSKKLNDDTADTYSRENVLAGWNPFALNDAAGPVQILMAGDSTMAEKRANRRPETGWGEMLQAWFDEKDVLIRNHAKNGRSTRSFIEQGRWQTLLSQVRPGDYVFIQFGHNDQSVKKVERYTPPDQYQDNLTRFIADVRARDANPVLFTPVVRRRFNEQGEFYDSHKQYPDLVRKVANETGAPLIDMENSSRAILVEHGAERSKALYLHLQPGESANYPDGLEDDTHFSPDGARIMAGLVAKSISEQLTGLSGKVLIENK